MNLKKLPHIRHTDNTTTSVLEGLPRRINSNLYNVVRPGKHLLQEIMTTWERVGGLTRNNATINMTIKRIVDGQK